MAKPAKDSIEAFIQRLQEIQQRCPGASVKYHDYEFGTDTEAAKVRCSPDDEAKRQVVIY